jgi:hypothetical protein
MNLRMTLAKVGMNSAQQLEMQEAGLPAVLWD